MNNKLIVVNSNSEGNAYILRCGNEDLLIECGLPLNDIKKALDYDISNCKSLIITHLHQDHIKYINQYKTLGLPIYSCSEVVDKYKGVKLLPLGIKKKIGSFLIQAIPAYHNVECYAFLIEHKDIGRALYITDTNSFPYRLKNINHIFIEANYSGDTIIDNMCNNSYNQSASNNHLSIEQTCDILKQNYSKDLQSIVLLHLSISNSDARYFKKRVQDELGFSNVEVANKNKIIELTKDEF